MECFSRHSVFMYLPVSLFLVVVSVSTAVSVTNSACGSIVVISVVSAAIVLSNISSKNISDVANSVVGSKYESEEQNGTR